MTRYIFPLSRIEVLQVIHRDMQNPRKTSLRFYPLIAECRFQVRSEWKSKNFGVLEIIPSKGACSVVQLRRTQEELKQPIWRVYVIAWRMPSSCLSQEVLVVDCRIFSQRSVNSRLSTLCMFFDIPRICGLPNSA